MRTLIAMMAFVFAISTAAVAEEAPPATAPAADMDNVPAAVEVTDSGDFNTVQESAKKKKKKKSKKKAKKGKKKKKKKRSSYSDY